MSSEADFRIALLTIMALTICVAGYHRIQAAKSGERISHREEGFWLFAALRLGGLLMWIGVFAYLLNPQWMQWSAMPLPVALRWTGAGIALAGTAFVYWTLTNLGKNLTDTVVTRTGATLVTSGPYRWVRHPFYVSVALVLVGCTLLTANLLIGIGGVVVLALLAIRTPKEEQKLLDAFGEDYRVYRERTGAFWPKW